MERFLEKIVKWSLAFGRGLQTFAVTGTLLIIYVFGLGFSKMLAAFVVPGYLRLFRMDADAKTNWQSADGYDSDVRRLERQV